MRTWVQRLRSRLYRDTYLPKLRIPRATISKCGNKRHEAPTLKRAMASDTSRDPASNYTGWTNEDLIQRVAQLERELEKLKDEHRLPPSKAPRVPVAKPKREERKFDPSKYSTRLIALKFAYLGQRYNGFEYTPNVQTLYPTVEEALWRALVKGRLISPPGSDDPARAQVSWEGCEYSKCGRTDKGVSAFGQVIGIRVRSQRPLERSASATLSKIGDTGTNGAAERVLESANVPSNSDESGLAPRDDGSASESQAFDPVRDEIPYAQVLNRLLPPDIRVLAWCPSPPEGFSARFSCRERQYRYFFTQPAFSATPGAAGLSRGLAMDPTTGAPIREGWLDTAAMQRAAKKYEGLHDFRNLCKIDPTKQLTDFTRRIFFSDVRPVSTESQPAAYVRDTAYTHGLQRPESAEDGVLSFDRQGSPQVYEFVLHGSAFLWHQVRHMVAILFLIGQGLEKPELVDQLLDVSTNPCRPHYDLADDAPLVLWDCIFPREDDPDRKDALDWIYIGDTARGLQDNAVKGSSTQNKGALGLGGVVNETWTLWRERKMDEILAGSMLNIVARQGDSADLDVPGKGRVPGKTRPSQKVFGGGDSPRLAGRYVPVMQRPRQEAVEAINAKWLAKNSDKVVQRQGDNGRSAPFVESDLYSS